MKGNSNKTQHKLLVLLFFPPKYLLRFPCVSFLFLFFCFSGSCAELQAEVELAGNGFVVVSDVEMDFTLDDNAVVVVDDGVETEALIFFDVDFDEDANPSANTSSSCFRRAFSTLSWLSSINFLFVLAQTLTRYLSFLAAASMLFLFCSDLLSEAAFLMLFTRTESTGLYSVFSRLNSSTACDLPLEG